jgi:hypothetical protein
VAGRISQLERKKHVQELTHQIDYALPLYWHYNLALNLSLLQSKKKNVTSKMAQNFSKLIQDKEQKPRRFQFYLTFQLCTLYSQITAEQIRQKKIAA